VLTVSPAARWDDALELRKIAALPKKPRFRRTRHPRRRRLRGRRPSPARHVLVDRVEEGRDSRFVDQEGGQHDENSWAFRVEGMLLFLYGTGKR